jgi:hypothetical protein
MEEKEYMQIKTQLDILLNNNEYAILIKELKKICSAKRQISETYFSVRKKELFVVVNELKSQKEYDMALSLLGYISDMTQYFGKETYLKANELIRQLTKESDELKYANNLKTAKKYKEAADIYEKYQEWDEAGRCRDLDHERNVPKTKVDIGNVDQSTRIGSIDKSTNINDSVLVRSPISGGQDAKLQICPYCGKDLDFPKPPRFCPYCREQILK